MKVENLNLGLLSTCLPIISLLGVIVLFIASSLGLGGVALKIVETIVFDGALLITPTIGLISGILSFFDKPKTYVLPLVGTLLNAGWFVFLTVVMFA